MSYFDPIPTSSTGTASNPTVTSSVPYAIKLDDTSTSNVTYVAEAAIASLGSAAVWRIKKLDEVSGLVITWADGNADFDNIWNNRTSISYS